MRRRGPARHGRPCLALEIVERDVQSLVREIGNPELGLSHLTLDSQQLTQTRIGPGPGFVPGLSDDGQHSGRTQGKLYAVV